MGRGLFEGSSYIDVRAAVSAGEFASEKVVTRVQKRSLERRCDRAEA